MKWFTASELAGLALPGLPQGRTNLLRMIAAQKWNLRLAPNGDPLARKRQGRGGGFEYHLDLLPQAARAAFTGSKNLQKGNSERPNTPDWAWFERQNTKTKTEANRRLLLVNEIEDLAKTATRSAAVRTVVRRSEISESTLWNWLGLLEGVAKTDYLPVLAPRRKGGGVKCEIHPEIWLMFKSDLLRGASSCLAAAYDRVAKYAAPKSLPIPHLKTLQRRFLAEVDPLVILKTRQGDKALERAHPHQTRTVADLHPMHTIVLDGHTFDVFVAEKGKTDKKNSKHWRRLTLLAIQDLYSRKIVGFRIGYSETIELTRLALFDVFKNFGIPIKALMDNGRAFASKEISGGAKHRHRYRRFDEEHKGLLASLGIDAQFATPGHGQAKPIERGFRDLCESIAKHPFCEGAYTGNSPTNTPHNRGARAIIETEFIKFAIEEICKHNAKTNRRTETAKGRSFDEVFFENYATAPIGKASEEQMRLALLTSKVVKSRDFSGEIMIHENRYHSPIMVGFAGQNITVKYDPDNLWAEVYAYKMSGEFIGALTCIRATGFFDQAGSKEVSRGRKAVKAAAKALLEKEALLSAKELAARYRGVEGSEPEAPKSNVIRPIGMRRGNLAAKPSPHQHILHDPETQALQSRFDAAMERQQAENANEERAILQLIQGGLSTTNIEGLSP